MRYGESEKQSEVKQLIGGTVGKGGRICGLVMF